MLIRIIRLSLYTFFFFRRQIDPSKTGALRFSSSYHPIRQAFGSAYTEPRWAYLGATEAGKAWAPGDTERTLPGPITDGQCWRQCGGYVHCCWALCSCKQAHICAFSQIQKHKSSKGHRRWWCSNRRQNHPVSGDSTAGDLASHQEEDAQC